MISYSNVCYAWVIQTRASLVSQLVKNLPAIVGDLGLIPGLGRSPREGEAYPFQYSGLEISTNCIVHGVAKSWTGLSDFHLILIERRSPSLQADILRSEPPGKPDYGTEIGQVYLPY